MRIDKSPDFNRSRINMFTLFIICKCERETHSDPMTETLTRSSCIGDHKIQ